jgi:Zn-dependent peptidase ImmA (M78 family)/transcriptional regulator with XRE-family HTH domain
MGSPTTKGFFVPERLSEARDARGITQKTLAEASECSDTTISQWEHGVQAPTPAGLEKIAAALNVFPSYFGKKMPYHGDSPVFFRSLANATKRVRTKEKARVRWLQHISGCLQETLEFPPVNIPRVVRPGQYPRLANADLEQIAADVRAHWKIGSGPIRTMVLVAENAGVVVGVDEVGSQAIDGQANWSEVDSRPYILLARDKYTAYRRQMDIAHELSHVLLHRDVSEDELTENFDLIESQAKYLAGAILMPPKTFVSEISSLSLDGFLALKKRWMVAIGAMIMRSRQLNVLSEEAAARLWKYRATRGWHRREPYDLPSETPIEEPRLLPRSIDMIIKTGVRSKRDLLEIDIGLGAPDVEMLAGLVPGYFSGEPAPVVRIEPRVRDREASGVAAEVIPFKRPT